MLKYTILYKNGKTWNGKAAHIDDLDLIVSDIVHITVKNSRGYTVLYPAHGPRYDKKSLRIEQVHLTRHTSVPKVRTPNPNSKTKKQKAFDQAYLEWTMKHFAKYDNCPSVKEYKKWLWEQKLANSSKFTSPVSPGDTIGYWASDSNELKWVTIKPDELIIKSAYDKDVALKDKDGFIPWAGGEIPVPGATIVDVKLRDGDVARKPAREFFWREFGADDDIVAYKVYDETVEKFNAAVNALKESVQKDIDRLSAVCNSEHLAWWKNPHLGNFKVTLYTSNPPPIKTIYTFWLGANGEIIDDK